MSLQELKDTPQKPKLKWSSYRSLLKNGRFWLVQVSVIIIAASHDVFELPSVIDTFGNVVFIPITLLWAPIIYSALTLGFTGTIVTVSLAFIASIPNFVFWHVGPGRFWEVSQLAIMMLIAILLARLIEQKREAEQRAKLYASHSVRTHEEEWRDIGRQVHDNTIQSLVTICLELDKIRYLGPALPSDVDDGLAKVRKYAEQAVDDLRSFTKDLRPTTLDELGLVVSIRRLVTSFSEQDGIVAEVEVIGAERRLNLERETIIFRIVQEALRNIARHASATEISVIMTFTEKETVLSVSDNGAGFDVPSSLSQLASGGKFGLIGMYEYAETLGGRLKIESRPGKGTRITAFIPSLTENQ